METIREYKSVLENYKNLINDVDNLIERSPFKLNFIIDKLGLTRSTFYHKRKNNSFTTLEIEKMLELFNRVD